LICPKYAFAMGYFALIGTKKKNMPNARKDSGAMRWSGA
jgi:hypothetical protein